MTDKVVILKELDAILASRLFSGKKQASNFLRYIVHEALAGRGDKITQYSIAVEALGKDPDYCPTENPAVRVEAGRVRKLLAAYYEDGGWASSVQFILPVGSYTPEFRTVGMAEHSRTRYFRQPRQQSVGAKIYLSNMTCPGQFTDPQLRQVACNTNTFLLAALGAAGDLEVALAACDKPLLAEDSAQIWEQYQAEFCFTYNLSVSGEKFKVSGYLWHTLSGEEVWSGSYELSPLKLTADLERMIAVWMDTVFGFLRGKLFRYWSAYWQQQDSIPEYYQVLVQHAYLVQHEVSWENFQLTLRVCQQRIRHYPHDTKAHLHYAILCFYAYLFKFEMEEPLETHWHEMTLRALELNPGSVLAHALYALVCYARGDKDLCDAEKAWIKRSNNYDKWSLLLLSIGLCSMGDWQEGLILLRDQLHDASLVPDPFSVMLCLAYFRSGHYLKLAHQQPDAFWESFGRLVSSCQNKDCQNCIAQVNEIVDKYIVDKIPD